MSYILALNCGSSSLKYQIYNIETGTVIISGLVEKIGLMDSFATQKFIATDEKIKKEVSMQNHNEALSIVMTMLREASIDMNDIKAVGHRVVHGGDKFKSSVLINDEVIKTIEELAVLAPLHNPANLMGIVVAQQLLPNAAQVAVFDTAFHQTMPDFAFRYAVPAAWYRNLSVRRYGFHGTSHLFVSKRAAHILGKDARDTNVISLHIGSGASAAAIKGGQSMDTTMGLTPMSGLTMSTRAGDIDSGIIFYVIDRLGITPKQVETHLNKDSGMLALSECSLDHRDIWDGVDKGDDKCNLAINVEVHNLKKYIGGFMGALGRTDAIIFTAGVGENDSALRAKVLENMEHLGIKVDMDKNAAALGFRGCGEVEISTPDSAVKVFVIPTNEEQVIIEDTIAIAAGTYNPDHLAMEYSFK